MRMTTKAISQSHWIGFLFLVPFIVMLAIHDALGLSDAFLLAKTQLDRDSQTFNLVMVLAFYLGLAGYLTHALAFSARSKLWLAGKLVFLAGYWSAILLLR